MLLVWLLGKSRQGAAPTPTAPSATKLKQTRDLPAQIPHQNPDFPANPSTAATGNALLPVQSTTRLPSQDTVVDLIEKLRELNPAQRRKTIWELAQRGDSRAVKPLVDTMLSADSQEQTLILTALSQISSRTLKPVNQALIVALQSDNPQVRKNAIRDSTVLYDLVLQVQQLLLHAAGDRDPQVRETAQWALQEFNKQTSPQWQRLAIAPPGEEPAEVEPSEFS
ncbi:MAG: hypothetical protein HC890_03115 [Chloroflexaceae bacterium]|nr:hypothetical protein [Chloroflexaceae bacterium]